MNEFSNSEFMDTVQQMLIAYYTKKDNNNDDDIAELRVKAYNKFGYSSDDCDNDLTENAVNSISNYFELDEKDTIEISKFPDDYLEIVIEKFLDKMVMWVALGDNPCITCSSLNEQKMKVRDAPPVHPNCRCKLFPLPDESSEDETVLIAKKLPVNWKPNSKLLLIKNDSFKPDKIRIYDDNGYAKIDIDLTNHGKPKSHPVVPHKHEWNWDNIPPRGKWKGMND